MTKRRKKKYACEVCKDKNGGGVWSTAEETCPACDPCILCGRPFLALDEHGLCPQCHDAKARADAEYAADPEAVERKLQNWLKGLDANGNPPPFGVRYMKVPKTHLRKVHALSHRNRHPKAGR